MSKDENTLQSSTIVSVQDKARDFQRADITSIAGSGRTTSSVSPNETALYVSDMLGSLENLATSNKLSVLALMLAMARDQADDDAGKLETDCAHATR